MIFPARPFGRPTKAGTRWPPQASARPCRPVRQARLLNVGMPHSARTATPTPDAHLHCTTPAAPAGWPAAVDLPHLLAQAGLHLQLTPRQNLTSSVTTAWGVAWDEAMIARDLLQNFFDANRAALDQVCTRAWPGGVQVSAPAAFDLNRLFYLGSEKGRSSGSDEVGEYGEGFKAAAICLLRDHGVQPVCISGGRGVVLSVSAETVTDTALRPVVYSFFDVTPAVAGTVLLLPTRSPRLVDAVAHGLDGFLHPGNPLLGEKIFETDDLALHHAHGGDGHLFYRHLRRCTVPGYPLVWVVRCRIATVERRISQDRDRNAFGGAVRGFYLRGYFQMAMRRHSLGWPQACQAIIQAGQPHWERGHPVLAELAQQLHGYRGDLCPRRRQRVCTQGLPLHRGPQRDPAR